MSWVSLLLSTLMIFIFFMIINKDVLNKLPTIKQMFLSLFTMIIGIAFLVIIIDCSGVLLFLKFIGFFMLLFGISTGISVLKKI
ncbi:hypothetical protein C3495_13900 (plasmid) [Clostridiaceae bacterium 14S0207]|nr:hypothetical protein C3495_13900 [Clostridiaceae bacterium 14S0207]